MCNRHGKDKSEVIPGGVIGVIKVDEVMMISTTGFAVIFLKRCCFQIHNQPCKVQCVVVVVVVVKTWRSIDTKESYWC
jgi:hypothetical protein